MLSVCVCVKLATSKVKRQLKQSNHTAVQCASKEVPVVCLEL